MTSVNQIWKCNVCGNIIEIVHKGADSLVCCEKPMVLISAKSEGEYAEKHSPVIDNNLVKIGSVEHPMEEDHYIEWIEATGGKEISKVFLKPDQKPEAKFCFKPVSAKMYCNKHGLWENKN